ncbi:MAG: hypothetical protein LH630_02910 [Actinomycetia bacterium]|nr:hypothetical protein [Actinomycetes bacterium]
MSWAIIDVDGVLADVRHRLEFIQTKPKDWDAFFGAAPHDAVLPQGLARAQQLAEQHTLVYLTGRPERCRNDTQHWLDKHSFPPGEIVMRPDTDRRPARFFKLNQARRLARSDEVAVVVDDDDAVIDTLQTEGFTVEHATWMDDVEQGQATLFDAQEREGRT